jgi:hypothetical protein
MPLSEQMHLEALRGERSRLFFAPARSGNGKALLTEPARQCFGTEAKSEAEKPLPRFLHHGSRLSRLITGY